MPKVIEPVTRGARIRPGVLPHLPVLFRVPCLSLPEQSAHQEKTNCPWFVSHGGSTFELCSHPYTSRTSPLYYNTMLSPLRVRGPSASAPLLVTESPHVGGSRVSFGNKEGGEVDNFGSSPDRFMHRCYFFECSLQAQFF